MGDQDDPWTNPKPGHTKGKAPVPPGQNTDQPTASGQAPGYPPAPGEAAGYPPAPGQAPGYPPAPGQAPGYPPAPGQAPGYPPAPGQAPGPAPGYPPAPGEAAGYPPAPGQVPAQAPSYPPAQSPGQAPSQQPGYPPAPGPAPGYAPAPAPGYPPAPGPAPAPGYAPAPAPGYAPAPAPAPGYASPTVQAPGYSTAIEMTVPACASPCPPGLEYLTAIDQMLIHQEIEILEVLTTIEMANKYTILNSMGQKIYYATEDSDFCTRNICGPLREFDMRILDNAGREVIHLFRPLRCSCCLCFCCLQKMEVHAPNGHLIGYVVQDWTLIFPNFSIQNAEGDTVLTIKGPLCTWSICGDVEFQVMSADGEMQVGKITKQWSGLLKEAFTDADNFGVTFPIDLDVRMKAVLLGAVFLIDFMYYEQKQQNDHHHHHH